MGTSLFSWFAAASLTVALTYLSHRLLRIGRLSIDFLSFWVLGILWSTAYMFGLGIVGLLRPDLVLYISLLGLLGVLLVRPSREAIRDVPGEVAGLGGAIAAWWTDLPAWVRWLSATAVLASVLRFAFLIWALPPFVWDSLSYHLTNLAHWIQAGRIELFQTPVARIYNPANFEVLAIWPTLFLHHDVIVESAGLPAYGLAILAVYSVGRGLRTSRAAASLGALAFGSTPAVILAATATKNDIYMAAYYLTALALITELGRRPAIEATRRSLNVAAVLAITLLLAVGTKTYIAHLVPGLVMVAALGLRKTPVYRLWREHAVGAFRTLRSLERRRAAVLVFVILIALVLGGFWNLRNWALTGNPFFPYDVFIAGGTMLEGPGEEFRLSVSELMLNFENIAAKFGDWRDPIRPDLPNTTGWGWFVYAIGLPTLAWSIAHRRSDRVLALGFVVSFMGLMLSTGPSPWNMRFAIWVPAVFGLSFAGFYDALAATHWRALKAGILGMVVICVGLNFIGTLNYNRVDAEEFRSMLSLPASERHAALFEDNMPEAYRQPIEFVPPGALLGYNVHDNGWVYPLYRADFSQRIVYVPIEPEDSCNTIARAAEARGTRYISVAPVHTDDAVIAKLEACAKGHSPIRERAPELYVVKR